jgi:hypothetical protein
MLMAYTECEISKLNSDKQKCDCMLTGIPANDQQSSLPGKQKEIIQQTDWKYISTAKEFFTFALPGKINIYPDYPQCFFASDFSNSVFRPPAILLHTI